MNKIAFIFGHVQRCRETDTMDVCAAVFFLKRVTIASTSNINKWFNMPFVLRQPVVEMVPEPSLFLFQLFLVKKKMLGTLAGQKLPKKET